MNKWERIFERRNQSCQQTDWVHLESRPEEEWSENRGYWRLKKAWLSDGAPRDTQSYVRWYPRPRRPPHSARCVEANLRCRKSRYSVRCCHSASSSRCCSAGGRPVEPCSRREGEPEGRNRSCSLTLMLFQGWAFHFNSILFERSNLTKDEWITI